MTPPRRRSKGDCLRQCVARIVGRKPHRVPDFVNRYKGRWSYYLAHWCERTGHGMLLTTSGRDRSIVTAGLRRWIAIGPSSCGKAAHAIVVGINGVEYDGGVRLASRSRPGNPFRLLVIWKRRPRRPRIAYTAAARDARARRGAPP